MDDSIVKAVKVIKAAILKSQSAALHGIGRYVSRHSREGTWGTGAIAAISERLQKELTGLRGFRERNIKNMRTFYEFWSPMINRQPAAAEFDLDAFLSVGFSHHVEIMAKAKTFDECFFYIKEAKRAGWSKYQLRDHLKADDYHHVGKLPNNFTATMSSPRQALAAVQMFKDEYLLDFVNVEDVDARGSEDVDERVVENAYKKPHENPLIGIILCKSADKAFVEYAVRDYDKPMGVATYRTADEMPERLRKSLPSIDELRRQLEVGNE